MKTQEQLLAIVEKRLGLAISEVLVEKGAQSTAFNYKISSERMFMNRQDASDEDEKEQPSDQNDIVRDSSITDENDKKTIFFIVKFGKGQWNQGVANLQVNISVLSEEGTFYVALDSLRRFISSVNYQFLDGIIQTYFEPSVVNAESEVYAGYRALIELDGLIKVPMTCGSGDDEVSVMFVTNVLVGVGDATPTNIPFITESLNHTVQQDPQSFPQQVSKPDGEYEVPASYAVSLGKQAVQTITIVTFLYDFGVDSPVTAFTRAVINGLAIKKGKTTSGIQQKFHVEFVTNLVDRETKKYLDFVDAYFMIASVQQLQDWGDITPVSITMTRVRKTEHT